MTEKVILSKKQADALESARRVFKHDAMIIKYHLSPHLPWLGKQEELNRVNPDTLISALYVGYEVELTPEERLRECYEKSIGTREHRTSTIKHVLKILGIEIEGINK
jgi:hypothetical protein